MLAEIEEHERARRGWRGTRPIPPARSPTPRTCCSRAATRDSVSCWSRAWPPAACPSPTTSSTDPPTSSITASTASWCRAPTRRRSPHQVAEVANASRRRLRRMRKAARRRAADFLPSAVLPRWGPTLEAAAERARARAGRPEPSLDDVWELERVAGLYRFLDCRLEATITDVTWDDDSVATVVVSCVIVGAGDRTGEPEVDVELIHRPTGTRCTPPVVEKLASDPSAGHPTTILRITLDPSTAEQPADHVVVLRARLGAIDVLDTPQPRGRRADLAAAAQACDVPAGADPGAPQRPPPGHGLAARRRVGRAGARSRAARRHRYRERRRGQHRRRRSVSTEARRSRQSGSRTAGTA